MRYSLYLTNGGQQTRDRSVVSGASGLVLANDTAANTLNNTDLGGLLVIKLAQAEGESAELLDNLGESLAGARTLQAVGGGGTAVQGGTVVQVLDLTVAQREANLDTPDLTNLGDTVTTDTITGGQDDLLAALNLVTVEQPAGGVLDDVAAVGLGDLLEESGHLGLSRSTLGGGLLLLLIGALSEQTGGNHKAQQKLVGVVSSDNEVSLRTGDGLLGGILLRDVDHVTDDGTEAINLSTELDLDVLTGLQDGLGLGGLGDQRSVGSYIGARRDGGRASNTF